ncbi:MAG: hypothetical protein WCD35_19630 [Mycobacteriales bacterium]
MRRGRGDFRDEVRRRFVVRRYGYDLYRLQRLELPGNMAVVGVVEPGAQDAGWLRRAEGDQVSPRR